MCACVVNGQVWCGMVWQGTAWPGLVVCGKVGQGFRLLVLIG
jgi:hypothetical protein